MQIPLPELFKKFTRKNTSKLFETLSEIFITSTGPIPSAKTTQKITKFSIKHDSSSQQFSTTGSFYLSFTVVCFGNGPVNGKVISLEMIKGLWQKFRNILDLPIQNKHLKVGLPFFCFIGFGLFWLREFQTVRYEFRKFKPLDFEEVQKHNIKLKKRVDTLEEAYEKMKNLDIDNWENIRGPKYFFDNEEVQNYHWGKTGRSSLVGKVAQANSGVMAAEDKPFAEFWMGTHPNGPSHIKSTKVELSLHLNHHPDDLGPKVISQFGAQLPFLFKILSVEKPLSIQAHPTKSHAKDLHRKFPEIYKDANHKPELAIAITSFEALCGFRPLPEIKYFLQNVPEFKMLIDLQKMDEFVKCSENAEESRDLMKSCFQSLMLCEERIVASAIEKLLARCQNLTPFEKEKYLVPVVERLCGAFPKDVGAFCVYWLNHIVLLPGEALYLAPNEPHAYLQGDCVECMANSDNVVRAALTPKFRDIETLCQMLTYKSYHPSEIKFHPVAEDEFHHLYSPPINDFAVAKISIPKGKKHRLKKRESASILVVLDGKGKLNSIDLEFGKVLFITSASENWIDSDGLLLFQAFCNV